MSTQPTSHDAGAAAARPRLPLQFSLRTLLVATTVFAAWCAFVAIMPPAFSQLLVGAFWFVATGFLVTGIFFARGDERAFCIGAALVTSSMWTRLGGQYMQGVHSLLQINQQAVLLWLDLAVIAATAVANGWCCVRARRFFERNSAEK